MPASVKDLKLLKSPEANYFLRKQGCGPRGGGTTSVTEKNIEIPRGNYFLRKQGWDPWGKGLGLASRVISLQQK